MSTFGISELLKNDGMHCSCGREHYGLLCDCIIGEGAIYKTAHLIKKYGICHPFVLCDSLTYKAAGEELLRSFDENGIVYSHHIIQRIHPAPDERIVGEALMHCGNECDGVIAVGGGVINDTCKIIASAKNVVDIFVATAPSMDGFASATSSMERGGFKMSLNSKCPEAVVADTKILMDAPGHLIRSGVGDMLAKYISIAEWKIGNLILGEYYCDYIANVVGVSLDACVKNAKGALNGDGEAVGKIAEGLVISGLAMNYAGISRPASGMEHYISHILDMRALEFGTPSDYHGIQCGIATLTVLKAYEKLAKLIPNKEFALTKVEKYDKELWNKTLRENLGKSGDVIVELENKEQKFSREKHRSRIEKIIDNWDSIVKIINTLPSSREIEKFMVEIGHPTSYKDIGIDADQYRNAFLMAKDVRDKYVLGRLLWDLGLLDEFAFDPDII